MGHLMKRTFTIICSLLVSACSQLPENIQAVQDFDVERYMGTWYEIARLDHRFERGLTKVSATYSLKPDGSVKVINTGYNEEDGEWREAVGKARFAGKRSIGHLEVSFFGPFYGAYVIFELDKRNYQYAFVTGGEDYLWLLSRQPTVDDKLKERFIRTAQQLGYDVQSLILVKQE